MPTITPAQLAALTRHRKLPPGWGRLDGRTLPAEVRTKPKRVRKLKIPLVCRAHMIDGLRGTYLDIRGLKLTSEANAHEHWRKRHKRSQDQRAAIEIYLRTAVPCLPILCRIVRIGPRKLDSDNAWGSAKHVRDQIADHYGVNDNDETKIKWDVTQEVGKEYAVRIELLRT